MSLPLKRAVIDTNVLVSAALSSKGNPAQIMNLVSDRKIQLFCCPAIKTQENIISAVEELGILVEPPADYLALVSESTDSK